MLLLNYATFADSASIMWFSHNVFLPSKINVGLNQINIHPRFIIRIDKECVYV